METLPQWLHLAILNTTLALLGLFSWLVLATHVLHRRQSVGPCQPSCYTNHDPNFLDELAFIRQRLWQGTPLLHVAVPGRQPKTPSVSASPIYGSPLLHRMNVQS